MIDRTYEEYKEIVEKHLMDFIPNIDNKSISLYEAMKYSLCGRQRLRPVLLLASCEFAGGNIRKQSLMPVPWNIHTYSLIHDDLPAMDNDDLRRGLPYKPQKVYGEALAILAGDGLLTCAFEAISKDMMMVYDSPEKDKEKGKCSIRDRQKGAGCQGMVAGQVSDIEAENAVASKEMLEYIHLNKTGALIGAAVKTGLYLGNRMMT